MIRTAIILLAVLFALISVLLNRTRHDRLSDACLVAAYLIIGAVVIIWRVAP